MSRGSDSRAGSVQTSAGGGFRRAAIRQKHQANAPSACRVAQLQQLSCKVSADIAGLNWGSWLSTIILTHSRNRGRVVVPDHALPHLGLGASSTEHPSRPRCLHFIPSHPDAWPARQPSPTKHLVDRSPISHTRPSAVCCCRIALRRHVGQIREGDDDQGDGRRCRRCEQSQGWRPHARARPGPHQRRRSQWISRCESCATEHVTSPSLTARAPGLPQAAAEQPIAHQDADIGHPLWSPRVPRIVDRPRQEQVGPLLHLACSQDGHLRCLDQRAPWTRPD